MEEFCWSWWFFFYKNKSHWFSFWFCIFDETCGPAMVFLTQYCIRSLFGTHILWNPHHSKDSWESTLELPASRRSNLFRISPLESWIQQKKHWLANVIFEIQTFCDSWNALVVFEKKLGIGKFPSSASSRKQRWYQILSHCKAGGNLFLKPGSFIERIEGCNQEYWPCDETVQQIKPPYKRSKCFPNQDVGFVVANVRRETYHVCIYI